MRLVQLRRLYQRALADFKRVDAENRRLHGELITAATKRLGLIKSDLLTVYNEQDERDPTRIIALLQGEIEQMRAERIIEREEHEQLKRRFDDRNAFDMRHERDELREVASGYFVEVARLEGLLKWTERIAKSRLTRIKKLQARLAPKKRKPDRI